MEKLSDILENIKERTSNPLVFTFVISWIFFNWKVSVALVWFDAKQIEAYGFKSIFDFIYYSTNYLDSFIFPLLIAIAYTVFMPLISSWVSSWQTRIDTKRTERDLQITKASSVPAMKFIDMKKEYNDQIAVLSNTIKEQSATHTQLQSEIAKSQALEKSVDHLNTRIQEEQKFINDLTDWKVLEGDWQCIRTDKKTGLKQSQYYEIHANQINRVDANRKVHIFNINNLSFHSRHKRIFFVLVPVAKDEQKSRKGSNTSVGFSDIPELYINELRYTKNRMFGLENLTTDIEYIRINVNE